MQDEGPGTSGEAESKRKQADTLSSLTCPKAVIRISSRMGASIRVILMFENLGGGGAHSALGSDYPFLIKNSMRNMLPILLLLALGVVAEAESPWSPKEAQLKAAMLLNFGRFTVYPEERQSGPFRICLLGESPFGKAVDTIVGKQVRKQVVEVSSFEQYSPDLMNCHVIYISSSIEERYQDYLEELRVQPVLTVSQIPSFADEFGIIQMVDSGRVVKFRINIERAKIHGLSISSRLLRIASIVK
jgi:hypothetical protein